MSTSIQLQVADSVEFKTLLVNKTITTSSEKIDLTEDDFITDMPTDETLYSRFRNSGNHGNSQWSSVVDFAIFGPWEGVIIPEPIKINSETSYDVDMASLTTDKVVVCYRNQTRSGYTYGQVIDLSGDTPSIGASIQCNSYNTYDVKVEKLDNSRVLVCFRNNSNSRIYGQVLTVSGLSFSSTTAVECTNVAAFELSMTVLSSSKAIIGYQNRGVSGDHLYVRVMIISASSGITLGTARQGNSVSSYEIALSALDSTRAIVCYRNSGNDNMYGIVLTSTGTSNTISVGSITRLSTHIAYRTSVTAISNNRAIFGYRNNSDNGRFYAQILNITGSTITPGAAVKCTDKTVNSTALVALSDERVLAYYSSGGLWAQSLTLSGISISTTEEFEYHEALSYYISATVLTSNKIIVCWSSVNVYVLALRE